MKLIGLRRVFVPCMLGLSVCAANAEDLWPCEVLLCLANPNGPMAVAECVPPITRLLDVLWHDGPFPVCNKDDGNGNSTHDEVAFEWFDPCPADTSIFVEGTHSWQQDESSPRICASGSHVERVQDGDGWIDKTVYENEVDISQNASPFVIDVFIAEKLWNRTRL